MLQTQYKSKLSAQLSYPIGAELLSHGLEGRANLPTFELSFSDTPIGSTSDFQKMIEQRVPYVIVRVYFWRRDKSLSDSYARWTQEVLQGKWHFEVFPVLRSLKSKARDALTTVGLPLVADWMTKRRAPSWYYGQKGCELEFHPGTGTVEFRERLQFHDASRGRKFRAPVR